MRTTTTMGAKMAAPCPSALAFARKIMRKCRRPGNGAAGFPAMTFFRHQGSAVADPYRIFLRLPLHIEMHVPKIANIQNLYRFFASSAAERPRSRLPEGRRGAPDHAALQGVRPIRSLERKQMAAPAGSFVFLLQNPIPLLTQQIHRSLRIAGTTPFRPYSQGPANTTFIASLLQRAFFQTVNRTEAHRDGTSALFLNRISPTASMQHNAFFKTTRIGTHTAPVTILPQFSKSVLSGALHEGRKTESGSRFEGVFSSSTEQRGDAGRPDPQTCFYHRQQKVEAVLDEVKTIVADAQEAIAERVSHSKPLDPAEINRALDINRLSDQIYRDIERKIRSEKERRGL